MLLNQAKNCLKHSHSIVKRIGFELLMVCTIKNGVKGEEIDHTQLNLVLTFLPIILSASEPKGRNRILESLKKLLQSSSYAKYVEGYLNDIVNAQTELKALYEINCVALASTKHAPLCKLGKHLISKTNIEKLTLTFTQKDKIEIALAFIKCLLLENLSLALECVATLDLKEASLAKDHQSIFISLINALIDNNNIDQAKDQLSVCEKNEILLHNELETTKLWIKLLRKAIEEKKLPSTAAAEQWLALISEKALCKNHIPDTQIEFLTELINTLFDLKNEHSNKLANKLITHLISFNLSESQKSGLFSIIENGLKACLSKERISKGYLELKNKSGLHLTENSKLNLRTAFLEAAIDHEDFDLAIEILTVLQNQTAEKVVFDAFEKLISALLQSNNGSSIEEKNLMLCYRLLKEIDLPKKQATKGDYILKWLTVANQHSNTFFDENNHLLKMALQLIENRFLTDDSMIGILDHLFNSIKQFKTKNQQVPNDLKNLMISCHPQISQKLQTATQLDKFCEYLNILTKHQISMKIPQIVLTQAAWIADEFLKMDLQDASKLQEIHNLLILSLQFSTPSKIEINIAVNLATALLALQLLPQAMKWVEYTIAELDDKISAETDLSLALVAWCRTLLGQNELQLCLTPLKALTKTKCLPSIEAELYLNLSKAHLDRNPEISANLLLDNWDFLQTNCISKGQKSLEEFLKNVIRKIFIYSTEIDALFLFSSLMAHYKSEDSNFLLEQLKNCSAIIDTSSKKPDLKNDCSPVIQIINSTFFSTKHSHSISLYLIEYLISSPKKGLMSLGIAQLNIHMADLIKTSSIENPRGWQTLSDTAIKNWFVILKDFNMSSLELFEIDLLIASYSKFLKLNSFEDHSDLEKGLSLHMFKASTYHDWEGVEHSMKNYLVMLKKYGNDPIWVGECTSLLVDALINAGVRSNEYLNFMTYYKEFSEDIYRTNQRAYSRFMLKYIEKGLGPNLQEGILRTFLINNIAHELRHLLSIYKTSDQNEITEIINLIDKFLFCVPIIWHEYLVYIDLKNNQVEEYTYDLASMELKSTVSKKPLQPRELEYYKTMAEKASVSLDESQKIKMYEYELTRGPMISNHQMVFESFKKSEYCKGIHKIALVFKLAATSDLEENVSDIFDLMSGIKSPDLFNIFTKIIQRYIAHKIISSSEKAFSIVKFIPFSLWQNYTVEFTNLLMEVMNNDQLYPQAFTHIQQLLENLHISNKCILNWDESSSKLFFHLLDKYNQYLAVNDDLSMNQPPMIHLQNALNLFSRSISQGYIKKNHSEFIGYFKIYLQRLACLSPLRFERQYLARLIMFSYDSNSNFHPKIHDLIGQYLNQLLSIRSELFSDNIQCLYILADNNFFKGKALQLENILKKYVTHFDIYLNSCT
ncbi:MAG: hypothetical protein H0U49_04965, partial [Parachlamydiaceae bacterium]|nr:hypothetical protein [Parachlamydiaceae bacterium]